MISLIMSLNIMMCDIKGEVMNPGVYEIKESTNINDVVNLAGGFTKQAEVNYLNLSKKVNDEMVIYIPNKKEKPKVCPPCNCPTSCEIKVIPTTTKPVIVPSTTLPRITTVITTTKLFEKTNLNTATLDELTLINGIGEVIAMRIIEYRLENQFEKIEDILEIKGVGEVLFAKIKDFITV